MEIYVGSTDKITIAVPFTATSVDVKAYTGDILLYTFPTVTVETGGYSVVLPFSLVDNDKTLVLKWKFDYLESLVPKVLNRSTTIEVVTPYATVAEIREAVGSTIEVFSDTDLNRHERRIRKVIDGYTGQSFGCTVGMRNVVGTGDQQLKLPQRMSEITALTGDGTMPDIASYAIRGGGWYLGVSVNASDEPYSSYNNVISSPNRTWSDNIFKDNAVYNITGTWGYEPVPVDIHEAALILIEDQLDPDSEYRDRYLGTVRAADWNLVYNIGAFQGTGSVTADNLLTPFIRWSLQAI